MPHPTHTPDAAPHGVHTPADGHPHHHTHAPVRPNQPPSVLRLPAWQRVLAVLPVLMLLWLAVWWANTPVQPW